MGTARNGSIHFTDGMPGSGSGRQRYLSLLTWAFTLFNSVRVVSYLPTLWAIVAAGDSSQHSMWTWITWVGANATMALWLLEGNGHRVNKAIAVTLCNTLMCAVTLTCILVVRL